MARCKSALCANARVVHEHIQAAPIVVHPARGLLTYCRLCDVATQDGCPEGEFCADGGDRCIDCRNDGDCGADRCVDEVCVVCDPATHAGCVGDTPFCLADGEGNEYPEMAPVPGYHVNVLVHPDHEAAYRAALADVLVQTGFDVPAALKALLSSAHFHDPSVVGARLKTPMELLVGLQRELGLTPSQDSTGEKTRMGRITKQGFGSVRALLVEASWRIIRDDVGLRRKYEEIKRRFGSKKAVVAIARRLAIRMRRLLIDQAGFALDVAAA